MMLIDSAVVIATASGFKLGRDFFVLVISQHFRGTKCEYKPHSFAFAIEAGQSLAECRNLRFSIASTGRVRISQRPESRGAFLAEPTALQALRGAWFSFTTSAPTEFKPSGTADGAGCAHAAKNLTGYVDKSRTPTPGCVWD